MLCRASQLWPGGRAGVVTAGCPENHSLPSEGASVRAMVQAGWAEGHCQPGPRPSSDGCENVPNLAAQPAAMPRTACGWRCVLDTGQCCLSTCLGIATTCAQVLGVWLSSVGLGRASSRCLTLLLQCHRIHRSLASQFKYALVWVSLGRKWARVGQQQDTHAPRLASTLRAVHADPDWTQASPARIRGWLHHTPLGKPCLGPVGLVNAGPPLDWHSHPQHTHAFLQ